jgi:Zn-dependent protease
MLTLLSALKFGKAAATGGTMLLSVAIYAAAFGWQYAAGFVGLLLIHELGHYMAARRKGLSVGAPIFIPFVGAYIALKQQPHDAETEAYVAIAGPLVGSFGAFAIYGLGRSLDS